MRGWFVPNDDGKTFKENMRLVGGAKPANMRSIALGKHSSLWKGKLDREDE